MCTADRPRRRKVAFVTPYFAPRVGGLEHYALRMARACRDRGDDVFVVTSNHAGRGHVEEEVEGIRVYRLPVLFTVSNTPVHPLWGLWARRILRAEQPDVINGHTPVPVLADITERVRGTVPYALTYHNDLTKPGLLDLACRVEHRLLTGRTLRRADSIIASSCYYAERSPRLRPFRGKVAIVAPGVDVDGTETPRPAPRGTGSVLFVGQLDRTHRHKGLADLIDAVAVLRSDVPGVELVVVGTGDAAADHRRHAARRGVERAVHFLGDVDDVRLRDLYRRAGVVALPSRDDAEGFGMVILEAAAVGTPAVATRVGGIPAAVIDGVTGLLVPARDPGALAAALRRVLTDPALRDRLGRRARARAAAEFAWPHQTERFLATIDELMARAPA